MKASMTAAPIAASALRSRGGRLALALFVALSIGVSGGTRSAAWCQIIADCLGVPAHVMDLDEPGAWGVAMLAFKTLEGAASASDFTGQAPIRATHVPDPDRHRRYGDLLTLYRHIASASFGLWTERARLDLE